MFFNIQENEKLQEENEKLKEENNLLKIQLMNVRNELAIWQASEKRLRRENNL